MRGSASVVTGSAVTAGRYPEGSFGTATLARYAPAAMGQPITVVEKPSSKRGVFRFEINRSLTGMGHERYSAADVIDGERPVDELARRLFARGGIDRLHVNSSIITVDCTKGFDGEGMADVIRGLFLHYEPGSPPPPDPV